MDRRMVEGMIFLRVKDGARWSAIRREFGVTDREIKRAVRRGVSDVPVRAVDSATDVKT